MEQYAKQWNEYIEENEETKGDLEEEEHVDEEDNDFIENSSITLNKMQRTDSDIVR